MSDRLTGDVSGDTGVYVWNLWSFQHELARGGSPFFSTAILAPAPRIDLSLHNYTPLLNAAALPLLPFVDIVTAFNLIFLLTTVVTAFSAFLLVRRLVPDNWIAWLAGAVFGFSSFLVARSTGHFSLAAAAPLPLFALALLRLEDAHQTRWTVAAGVLFAAALYSDPYYAVYCLVIWGAFSLRRVMTVTRRPVGFSPRLRHVVDGAILGVSILCASIVVTGGYVLRAGPVAVGLTTLYTPMLALVTLALLRTWLTMGPRVTLALRSAQLLRPGVVAGIVATAVLAASPWLHALRYRLADGGQISERIFWRTSPHGLDLLSLVIPNPMHPLFRGLSAEWFAHQRGLAIENVASLSLVALAVVVVAFWRFRAKAPASWWLIAGGSALLSLGPFVHVAGVNTYVPGPWAFLRYIPILSSARMPTRFAVLTALGVAVLFAYGLGRIVAAAPSRRRALLLTVSVPLLFELLPAPRVLYSAKVPDVYRIVAADVRDVAVMNLPLGMRDGVRSYGRFNTALQFYQAFHGKRIVGGYISRLSAAQIEWQQRFPIISALLRLSDDQPSDAGSLDDERKQAARFIERTHLGYVVVNRARTPPGALEYAKDVLRLELITESDGLALYRPGFTPSGQPLDGR